MDGNVGIITLYMFITVHMGVVVYMFIKLNIKAPSDMIFYHLYRLASIQESYSSSLTDVFCRALMSVKARWLTCRNMRRE